MSAPRRNVELKATDPDPGDKHTFALVPGAGAGLFGAGMVGARDR